MLATARKAPAKLAKPLIIGEPVAPSYGYRQVETALARAFGVEKFQETSFRARLKHFKKLGVPSTTSGPGIRIRYTGDDIFQLMVAIELTEFGLDPHLIAETILPRQWQRDRIPYAILLAQQARDKDMWVAMHANFMSAKWTDPGALPITFQFGRGDVDLKRAGGTRIMLFNLSDRVRAVEAALKEAAAA